MPTDRLLEDVIALLVSNEFVTGVGLGLVSAASGWIVGLPRRSRAVASAPGIAAVLVTGWLFTAGRAPTILVVIVPLLAIISALGALEGRRWTRAVFVLLGAAALALGAPGSLGFRVVLFLGVAAAAYLVSAAEEALEPRVPTTVLFAVSTGALLVGIPEVNRALLLAGSAISLALVPISGRRLGRAGAIAYPVLFAWIAIADGATAPGGVIGVFAALGVLGLGHLAPRLRDRIAGTGWLLLGQTGWALFASRVAGVRRGILGAVIALSIGGVVVWSLSKLGRRQASPEAAAAEPWGRDR